MDEIPRTVLMLTHAVSILARIVPVLPCIAPILVRAAPVPPPIAPTLPRTAPVLPPLAPIFSRIIPVLSCIAPILTRAAPVPPPIAPILPRTAHIHPPIVPTLPRTVPVLSCIAPVLTRTAPVSPSIAPILTCISKKITTSLCGEVVIGFLSIYSRHNWIYVLNRIVTPTGVMRLNGRLESCAVLTIKVLELELPTVQFQLIKVAIQPFLPNKYGRNDQEMHP